MNSAQNDVSTGSDSPVDHGQAQMSEASGEAMNLLPPAALPSFRETILPRLLRSSSNRKLAGHFRKSFRTAFCIILRVVLYVQDDATFSRKRRKEKVSARERMAPWDHGLLKAELIARAMAGTSP